MTKIDVAVINTAWLNWRNCNKDALSPVWNEFCKYVGSNPYSSLQDNNYVVPESAARKLHMLAGPHFQTVIKAYYIRKGEPHE